MRKSIITILLLALTFCFVGCNGNDSPSDAQKIEYGPETGEITFYVAGGTVELALWDNLIDSFEAQSNGITVKTILFSDYDTVYSALMAGNAPDVIQVPNTYFGNWAKAGALKPIQQFIDEEKFDTSIYWENLIEMFSYDRTTKTRGSGDLYALPKDYGVTGIYVNLKLLDAAVEKGLITASEKETILDRENPMTFEEYRRLAKKLTIIENNSVKQYGTNSISAESYLWNNGTDIVKDGKYLNVGDEKVYEAYEYIASMVDSDSEWYCAPSVEATASQDDLSMFLTEKIVMYWAGRWYAPSFDSAQMEYAIIPVPVVEKGQDSVVSAVSAGYCISRNSKKNGMAYRFIKFLAGEEAYTILNALNYAVPGIKSLAESDLFLTPVQGTSMTRADYETFLYLANNTKAAHADYFTSSRWFDIFDQNVLDYYYGDFDTIDACFKAMESEVNAAIRASDPLLFK